MISLVNSSHNQKKRLTVVIGITVLTVLIVAVLVGLKAQRKAERDYIALMKGLKTLGDKAISEQCLVKAYEYYTHALKFGEKILLWPKKSILKEEIEKALSTESIKKVKQGYIFLDGQWVKRRAFQERYRKHKKIEKETNEKLLEGIAALKDKDYERASQEFYSVLKTLVHEPWLAKKTGNLNKVLKWALDIPANVTTPIDLAVKDNEIAVFKILLKHSDISKIKRKVWQLVVYLSATRKKSDMLKILLERGVSPNVKDDHWRTPLHYAAQISDLNKVHLLLAYKANLSVQDNSGQTPLHLATSVNNINIVRVLLKHGADPNIRDKLGQAPLYFAAKNNNVEMMKLLLEHGANPNAQGQQKQTLLHGAARAANMDMASCLVNHGANPNIQNVAGQTPLLLAVGTGDISLVSFLLKHGADPNIRDKLGQAPLYFAAKNNNVEMMKLLLEHGANPNAQGQQKQTLLHGAARAANMDMASCLVNHGANPNIQNVAGQTPLLLAVGTGDISLVSFLLKHGADPNIKDKYGVTALEVAYSSNKGNRLDMVKLLIKSGADTSNLQPIVKRVFAPLALKRAKQEALKIQLQANQILSKHYYQGDILLIDNTFRADFEKLTKKANSWFRKLSNTRSKPDTEKLLQSVCAAINAVSFSLDERTVMDMVDTIKELNGPDINIYIILGDDGSRTFVRIKDMKNDAFLPANKLTDVSPLIFGDKNYLILRHFSYLPGIEEIITDRLLDYVVVQELKKLGIKSEMVLTKSESMFPSFLCAFRHPIKRSKNFLP